MLGPSAPTGGPFLSTQTDWLEFALKRFSNRAGAGAGRRVSIAYVVGATHFPWVGAAIETQLATIPALTDCPPRNRPQMAWKNRQRGRNVPKAPAACSKARRPKVLAGAAPSIHIAAAIRCQVQSGAEPSRKRAKARIACSERMTGTDGRS
jgi:hypothetical protein